MPTETRPDLADLHARASRARPDEVSTELVVREGRITEDLRGVLFRNGPGKQEAFGVPYTHPFDGDGMIFRFAFEGGRVHYRNRFVRTSHFLAENRAGRMLYRGFGTNLPGGLAKNLFRTTFKNAANTSVVRHGGVLLALWEGGLPHAVAEDTLATIGPYDFEGKLASPFSRIERAISPHLPFSAHPRICPRTGELFGFGTSYGPKNRLLLYRVSPEGEMAVPEVVELPALTFLHDFVLTPSYRVFFDVPAAFDVPRALSGLSSPADAIRFGDGPTTIRCYPREPGKKPLTFVARSSFVFHFVNGFERDDGTIVIDAIRTDRFPAMPGSAELLSGGAFYPAPLLTRYELDPRSGKVQETCASRIPCELPTSSRAEATRDHGLVFAIAGDPLDENTTHVAPFFSKVARFDRHAGTERVKDLGSVLPGEPLFVPVESAPGGGYVLTLGFEGPREKSALFVLRADDLGTVAVCELPHGVPPGFHGTWVPERAAS